MIRSAGEKVVVERAVPNDAAQLAELERATFSDPWSADAFRALAGRKEAACFVARDAEALVGYVVTYAAGGEAELANLAVTSAWRRSGVASRLLRSAMDWARERQAADLWLEVRASNSAARGLYERFGFSEVGVRRHYYNQPVEDAIIMRCELRAAPGDRD